MKIAVIGSRGFPEPWRIDALIDFIAEAFPGAVIVSGGARGVDSWAEARAKQHGLEVQVFIPDWDRFGRGAGMIRNADIIKAADYVIGFWDGSSKGTKHSIDLARTLGKPLLVLQPQSQK